MNRYKRDVCYGCSMYKEIVMEDIETKNKLCSWCLHSKIESLRCTLSHYKSLLKFYYDNKQKEKDNGKQ